MIPYGHNWYTPPEYAARIRASFPGGQIDLDAASDEWANLVVGAERYYDSLGLLRDWARRTYVNHPGSQTGDSAKAWWRKACDEMGAGRVRSLCWAAFGLGQFRTLHTPVPLLSGAIVIPKRRLHWIDGTGAGRDRPNSDSAFVFFGEYTLDPWERSEFIVRPG